MNRYKGIADSGQREYITSHLNESMFVEAGAGAGKTTLIIERIVAQLVAGVKPEEIAAITFTNAAAEELRGRIVAEVKKRSVSNKKLTSVLHNIENMQISTIHSFCATLLKERCFEAGLPIGTKVLEDDDDEIRKGKIFDLWLTTLNEDELKEMYRVSDTSNKQAKRVIFDNFSKLADVSEYYKIEEVPEEEFQSFIVYKETAYTAIETEENARIKVMIDKYFANLEEAVNEAKHILQTDNPIKAAKSSGEKWESIEQGRKLYETTEGVLSAVELDAIIKLIKKAPKVVLFQDTKIKLNDKTREQEITSKIKALNERLVEHNIALFETLPKRTNKQKFDEENAKKEKSLIILKYSLLARKYYFENLPVKELNNNQLLEKAYELLKDEEVRKYFYNKFKCVYVDEFQDTDPLQESIVWNLTTLGNAENLKEGKLFVVGDPKQAIYRFRGADPVIYFKVKDRFEQSPYAGVFRLSINHRSNNKLIDYVNDFFADKGILWEEEESENSSSNPGGYEEMEDRKSVV